LSIYVSGVLAPQVRLLADVGLVRMNVAKCQKETLSIFGTEVE